MKAILKQLALFQERISVVKQTKRNDFGKYSYADYTDIVLAVKPFLKECGLVYYHTIDNRTIKTFLVHVESGEEITSCSEIIEMEAKGMNAYQVYGSGISYLKRYHLACLLGLATDEKEIEEVKQLTGELPLIDSATFEKACEFVKLGKRTVGQITSKYKLTEEQHNLIEQL